MRTPVDTDSAHSWRHSPSAAATLPENLSLRLHCRSSAGSLVQAHIGRIPFAASSIFSNRRRQLLPALEPNPLDSTPFLRMLPLCPVAVYFLRNNPPEAAASPNCSDLSRSTRSPLPTSSVRSAPAGTKSPLLPTPDLHTENLRRAQQILPKMLLV